MNPRNFPRPLLIGATYLALHAACQAVIPHASGLGGANPWMSAGLALALLAMGGLAYAPLVLVAMGASALLDQTADVGLFRYAWPVIHTGVLAALAHALRWRLSTPPLIGRVRDLWMAMLLLAVASFLSAGIGALGLSGSPAAGTQGARSLLISLGLIHFSGLLGFGLPLIILTRRLFAAPEVPAGRKLQIPLVEIGAQAALLALCVVLAVIRPSLWLCNLIALIPLVWISIRLGMPAVAPALLLYLAAKWSILDAAQLGAIALPSGVVAQDILVSALSLILGSVISAREGYLAMLQARYNSMERVLRGAQMGFWEWNGGTGMSLDGQWLGMMGYEPGSHDGTELSWRKMLHPADLSHVLWMRDAHWKGHARSLEIEYRVRCQDGSYRWVLDRGIIVERSESGAPQLMAGACLDISDRKQEDLQLRRIVQIMDSAADFIGAADVNGNMVYANQALMRLRNDTDLASVRRRHISEYFPEEVAKRILLEGLPAAIAHGSWWIETTLGVLSSSEVQVSLKIVVHRNSEGIPEHFSMIARDVSQPLLAAQAKKEQIMQEQLAGKYESLGVLAGGMAHDFNNLLTAMLGNAVLARSTLPDNAPGQAYFNQVEQAALRAADLCQLLHTYSGKGQANSTSVDLNACVRSVESSLVGLCGGRFGLTLDLCPESLPAQLDEVLIKRALRALVRNSVEACEAHSGAIVLRTGKLTIDAETYKLPSYSPDIVSGDYVFIEVSDNGAGMDNTVKLRLFEPFYSSRPGQAGLGLTKVLAAVRAHLGAVVVESAPGKGCLVRMLLPEGKALEESSTKIEPVPAQWRGAGQVLVVDDEEAVRTVATYMLESLGFSPLVAANGTEGLRIFRQHAGFLKAVLLDLSMPVIDGEMVYSDIRRLDAEVPVIVMSGYTEKEVGQRFKGKDLVGFLHKPFTMDSLRGLLYKAVVPRS